jgi:hypothetical protein
MKTIDTKSMLLGVLATLLVITLTGGKSSDEEGDLQIFSRESRINVFNKKTKILYEYLPTFKGKYPEKPELIYKVSVDGSTISPV